MMPFVVLAASDAVVFLTDRCLRRVNLSVGGRRQLEGVTYIRPCVLPHVLPPAFETIRLYVRGILLPIEMSLRCLQAPEDTAGQH